MAALALLLLTGAGLSWAQRCVAVEKQAHDVGEAARAFAEVASRSATAGRPVAMSVLQSRQAELHTELERLGDRVAELEEAARAEAEAERLRRP